MERDRIGAGLSTKAAERMCWPECCCIWSRRRGSSMRHRTSVLFGSSLQDVKDRVVLRFKHFDDRDVVDRAEIPGAAPPDSG